MKLLRDSQSLAGSLGRALSLGLLGLLLLHWLLVTAGLRHMVELSIGSRLEHEAESLLAALEFSQESLPLLDLSRLNPTYARPFSGHYYLLRSSGLELSSRSLWQHSLPLASDVAQNPTTGTQWTHAPGPRGQSLLVLQQRVSKGSALIELAVAEDLTPLEPALLRFNLLYALFSVLMLILLLGGQGWLIKRLLAPLLRSRAEIDALERGGSTPLSEDVPSEIRPLVTAFNRLLAVQQQRLERSRARLGDLSHALRRPLSRIQQMLESRPWSELQTELDNLANQIDHQLAKARQAGQSTIMAALELDRLLAELLPVLQKMFADKQLDIEMRLAPGLSLRMDRSDALELLGNLLENACKWSHCRILVQASQAGGVLRLTIGDDGAGVSEPALAGLTQRGVRADQQMPGHGLGLAIALDLVQSYGGSLELGRSAELGGFEVSLILPDSSKPT